MSRITKDFAKQIRAAIEEALDPVGGAFGVEIKLGTMTIYPDNIATKLEIAELTETGDALTVEASNFKRYASSYGLAPADLFREFKLNGQTYKIVGLRTRSKRSPIICEVVGGSRAGTRFVFAALSVKRLLYTEFGRDPLIG